MTVNSDYALTIAHGLTDKSSRITVLANDESVGLCMRRTRKVAGMAPELLTATLHRMKAKAGGLLGWALDFAQTELDRLEPTGWYSLRLELAAFLIPFSVEIPQRHGSLPSDEEVREVHGSFARIFSTLMRDHRVKIGRYDVELDVDENGVAGIGLQSASRTGPYVTWLMLLNFEVRGQYMIRTCLAPAPRARKGQGCGRWFLASRDTQVYCSRRCQSRAATQAFRHGRSPEGSKARKVGRRTERGAADG